MKRRILRIVLCTTSANSLTLAGCKNKLYLKYLTQMERMRWFLPSN